MLPIKADQVKQASSQDTVLSRAYNYIVNGWPFTVDSELLPFFHQQEQLTTEAGCILCGIRVLIPKKFCTQVLDELHAGHPGIVQMKSLARLHVWWPSIDAEIESVVHKCASCQGIRNNQPPTTLHLTPLDLADPSLAKTSLGFCQRIFGGTCTW